MPNSLRLFTGLAIEYPVRRNLELVLEHLRPLASVQWSPNDNFHITTKFIGAWDPDRLDDLKCALRSVAGSGPITVGVGGFGWYPNPHQPRVLFTGVRSTEPLLKLVHNIEDACESLGLLREQRTYSPHVTIARIKGAGANLAPLRQAIAQLPSAEFGNSTATKFLLYKSEPGEAASTYSVIGEFPL